ncbi:MAG: TonB-dependent receptor [Flammeovirgaceae bacterium]|nr:TonB-dependent receptor [Flammeovirgaceae bacterium]
MLSKLTIYGIIVQSLFLTGLLAEDSNAQVDNVKDVYLKVNLNDKTLGEALTLIEFSTGYRFTYDKQKVNLNRKINIKASYQSVYDLLVSISKNADVRFRQYNENISVTSYVDKNFHNKAVDVAQEFTIAGKVTSYEENEPLPGVSILIKGTSTGTTTDLNGQYKLLVPENATLQFSYIGFETQEVTIENQTELNIELKADHEQLEEVVVVGYGTQKRSDITGAVGVVNSKEFEDEPIIQVGQAIQGKVAGVFVAQNSGAPGSALLVRVRGTGTVNNADPLYVVDGNPNVDPIDLVPEQIESIQVLKSASAAAIYGAQGANGVILITTKQGKAGKSKLNINFSQGWQQIQKHLPMANATQYATLYNEGLINAGDAPIYNDPGSLGVGTDWQKEMFQVAPMTSLSVSASGGSESSKYFFSTGYTNQEGILVGSSFDRTNLRINSSHKISPAIKVGQNLSASISNTESIEEFYFAGVLARTLTANPEIVPRNPDGTFGYSTTSLNSVNPLAYVTFNEDDTRRTTLNGNVYADITFLKDFVFRSAYNFNITYSENIDFVPTYFLAVGQENTNATLAESTRRILEDSWANTLTYSKNLGKHNIEVLAGYTMQESTQKYTRAYGAGLPDNSSTDENLRYLDLSTQSPSVGGNGGSYGLLSYLGRTNYNYDDKYFVTVNFRADGSSRFGKNNKWGYFPSFSLGWKVSNEAFLQSASWINNLMLRGGWGTLGNQGSLPNYAFTGLVTPNINYVYGVNQAVFIGQAPTGQGNPDLKWETTEETGLGLDFLAFDGKFSAAFDWYRKVTTDMLLQVPLVGYAGVQDSPYVNGGSVLNNGIELMLGFENTTPSGFTYSVSVNMAHNKNKVLSLSNAGTEIFQGVSFIGDANVTRVGDPIASHWGWQTDGIFQTQEEVDNHAFQTSGTAPGDIRFKDIDGNGIIDADDQTIIGNPWPTLNYGMNGSMSYRNFDFRIQLQGVYGNDIFMGLRFRTEGSNFFNYTQRVWDERWTGPGTSNNVPRVNTNDPNNNMRSSDYYLEKGSYLRFRNIQLTYKVPSAVFKNTINMSVYGSLQNAITFSSYPGFDPEIGTNDSSNPLYVGIDEANYPVPRIYTLGLKMGF